MPGPNCLLGVCCPPRSAAAKQALADAMCAGLGWSTRAQQSAARAAAAWTLDNYDLMPLSSTDKLKEDIATLARENP